MLNEKYIEQMKKILGESGLKSYLDSLSLAPTRALRFNKIKLSKSAHALDNILLNQLNFQEGAYQFSFNKIGTHPYHHAGAIYVQEPSAMLPVSAVEIPTNAKILDMCASPGGKATQAGEVLKSGFLVANEIVPSRCKTLSGNIERLGFCNTVITSCDTKVLSDIFEDFFDLVIADAPCSGEGMFRKDEGSIAEWSVENVTMCAKRQEEILHNASRCVKKGGKILYSTCTFSLEENENNVKKFLDTHEKFSLIDVKNITKEYSTEGFIPLTRRVFPHLSTGEGQFFALFEKTDGNTNTSSSFKSALKDLSSQEHKLCMDFLSNALLEIPEGNIKIFKENIVLIPENLPVPDKITYSCGVTLGHIEKNVFRPHHHLFSALGKFFKTRLSYSPDSEEIKKYLHGDVFNCDAPDSWGVVMVDRMAIGGVKITSGVAKNHYPKGLRNL